jgi:2-oxo-4-hydroxy-4-carboxy--5-ureidoimidazoline (OHCU) decarboxylase
MNLPVSGPRPGGETLRDKLARKLEEHADEVVAAYLAGIRSDDPNRAYRAADAWISRVHGRPKDTVENVTVPDDPLDIASMTREGRDALKRELLRQHPELAQKLANAIRLVK